MTRPVEKDIEQGAMIQTEDNALPVTNPLKLSIALRGWTHFRRGEWSETIEVTIP
jgi:hypothetical protein